MEDTRKHLVDRFQEHLDRSYEDYCKRHGVTKSSYWLVTFLIDQDLIPKTQLQRFAVIKEFDRLNKEAYFNKTQTVNTIAHRFNISERTVWNILKHEKK